MSVCLGSVAEEQGFVLPTDRGWLASQRVNGAPATSLCFSLEAAASLAPGEHLGRGDSPVLALG